MACVITTKSLSMSEFAFAYDAADAADAVDAADAADVVPLGSINCLYSSSAMYGRRHSGHWLRLFSCMRRKHNSQRGCTQSEMVAGVVSRDVIVVVVVVVVDDNTDGDDADVVVVGDDGDNKDADVAAAAAAAGKAGYKEREDRGDVSGDVKVEEDVGEEDESNNSVGDGGRTEAEEEEEEEEVMMMLLSARLRRRWPETQESSGVPRHTMHSGACVMVKSAFCVRECVHGGLGVR